MVFREKSPAEWLEGDLHQRPPNMWINLGYCTAIQDHETNKDKIKLATNVAHLHLYLSISISISLKTRIAEDKKAVVGGFDQNSKVASHVHHFNHNMNFENVKVVEQLFLEARHSTLDPSAGNDYIVLSEVRQRYRASMNYMVTRASFTLRYFR